MLDGYKTWIENEYRQWIAALQESTVHNFKDHPMVKRMLGDFDPALYVPFVEASPLIEQIDNIGKLEPGLMSGAGLRMLYYAKKVMEREPGNIVEIGGGVGQFYATMRALGYEGRHFIFDIPQVNNFQIAYLEEVEKQTGLWLNWEWRAHYDFCVSFHALGEFDDDTKNWYIEHVVKKCPHGFIIWNPHSGASKEIPFECKVSPEYPMNHPDCRQLEW